MYPSHAILINRSQRDSQRGQNQFNPISSPQINRNLFFVLKQLISILFIFKSFFKKNDLYLFHMKQFIIEFF